jgi:hypothetical protein
MTKRSVGELLATDEEVQPLKSRAKQEVSERRIWIRLEENENIPPTGQFISVNGRTFVLKPGDPAHVPECIVNVLNDAVQDVPQIDTSTNQVIGYRKKLRFPYTVLTEAQVATEAAA